MSPSPCHQVVPSITRPHSAESPSTSWATQQEPQEEQAASHPGPGVQLPTSEGLLPGWGPPAMSEGIWAWPAAAPRAEKSPGVIQPQAH